MQGALGGGPGDIGAQRGCLLGDRENAETAISAVDIPVVALGCEARGSERQLMVFGRMPAKRCRVDASQ